MFRWRHISWLALLLFVTSCSRAPDHQLVLKGGTIYDGTGGAPYIGDLAIDADTISAIDCVSKCPSTALLSCPSTMQHATTAAR